MRAKNPSSLDVLVEFRGSGLLVAAEFGRTSVDRGVGFTLLDEALGWKREVEGAGFADGASCLAADEAVCAVRCECNFTGLVGDLGLVLDACGDLLRFGQRLLSSLERIGCHHL